MAKKTKSAARKPSKKPAKKPVKKVAARAKPPARPAKPKAVKAPGAVTQPASVAAVPEGFHTVTPHLTVRGAAQAIDFYQRVFDAKELVRMPGPGGAIMHAELQIGDSRIFLCDENERTPPSPAKLGGTAVALTLYLTDCDATYNRAVAAGAKSLMEPADMFWGDRFAKVVDPFGHEWALATHKEDVSPEEMGKRFEALMAQMSAPPAENPPADGAPVS